MTPTLARYAGKSDCTCPAPCGACPPLADDTEADAEYRTTRHLIKTTGRGRNPRPA